jgi:hypothetical protein
MESPKVIRVLHESGEVSDEVDWNLSKFLLAERGTGYVPCCASLVELEGGTQSIRLQIDFTALEEDGVYGYGIVGELFADLQGNVFWCSPAEEMERRRDELVTTVQPEKRPHHY